MYRHVAEGCAACSTVCARNGAAKRLKRGIWGRTRTSSKGRAAAKAAAMARSCGARRRSAASQRSRHWGQLAGPDRSWYSMLLRTHPEQTARAHENGHCT